MLILLHPARGRRVNNSSLVSPSSGKHATPILTPSPIIVPSRTENNCSSTALRIRSQIEDAILSKPSA